MNRISTIFLPLIPFQRSTGRDVPVLSRISIKRSISDARRIVSAFGSSGDLCSGAWVTWADTKLHYCMLDGDIHRSTLLSERISKFDQLFILTDKLDTRFG